MATFWCRPAQPFLVAVCGAHHWSIHQGYLRVTGEAPDGLHWERRAA